MLFRGGVTPGTEQNWYLRSELTPVVDPKPIYRPGVSIYTEVPSLARELAVQQIGTFHDRQGNQDLLTGAGPKTTGDGIQVVAGHQRRHDRARRLHQRRIYAGARTCCSEAA